MKAIPQFHRVSLLKSYLTIILLGGLLAIFTACEKTAYEIEEQAEKVCPDNPENAATSLLGYTDPNAFDVVPESKKIPAVTKKIDFDFLVTTCTFNARNISAEPKYKAKYYYHWVVDGYYAGNKQHLNCSKGGKITLTLTRVSDGAHVTKSLFFKQSINPDS